MRLGALLNVWHGHRWRSCWDGWIRQPGRQSSRDTRSSGCLQSSVRVSEGDCVMVGRAGSSGWIFHHKTIPKRAGLCSIGDSISCLITHKRTIAIYSTVQCSTKISHHPWSLLEAQRAFDALVAFLRLGPNNHHPEIGWNVIGWPGPREFLPSSMQSSTSQYLRSDSLHGQTNGGRRSLGFQSSGVSLRQTPKLASFSFLLFEISGVR